MHMYINMYVQIKICLLDQYYYFYCSYCYWFADFVQIRSSSGIDSKWISMFSRRSLRLGSAGRGAFPGISTVDMVPKLPSFR